jgi:hypothetical protein
MEQLTFNPEEFKELKPKAKFIVDNNPKKLDEKAKAFRRAHRVIEVKQRCSNVIILFYVDDENTLEG